MGAGNSLGEAVALEFSNRGVIVALCHSGQASIPITQVRETVISSGGNAFVIDDEDTHSFQKALDSMGRLDFLVNLSVPTPAHTLSQLRSYPSMLLDRSATVSQIISQQGSGGAIVNHCMMASAYLGTAIESEVMALKMSIVGVTRAQCVRYGEFGIRAHCLQTALVDLPEIKSFASNRALAAKVPLGRWATAQDVAKFISFLCLRATYMSGSVVVLDGGLTAGVGAA